MVQFLSVMLSFVIKLNCSFAKILFLNIMLWGYVLIYFVGLQKKADSK